jgi:ADP-ribose pyrophosphatase YjhB (NUDIX family)
MKVGVNVFVFEDEKILLTKRDDFEVWCLPGGHIDPGESVAQAAVREVFEETGLEVVLTRLVGVYSIPDAKAWVNLIILFAGEVVGGSLKRQEDEVLEMAYFGVNDIPSNLLWGHLQRIKDALSGIGGGVAWVQNVPFDPVENRQELYDLSNDSGLSGLEFYAQNFGWETSNNDCLEVG